MALGATIYTFDIDLNDVDRGVYQSLNLRVAQHPSETHAFLVTRMLAYCLEYAEGIGFSKGLSEPDEPAVFVRDLTGALQAWIDVGLPEPERLHRAGKAAPRVAVYVHKDAAQWAERVADSKVHRADALDVIGFDPAWIAQLVAKLDRRMAISLTRADGEIYLTVGTDTLHTKLERPFPPAPQPD